MEIAVAVMAGLFSAYLIYLLTNTLLQGWAGNTLYSPALKLSLFAEAWGFSTILLLKLSQNLTEVIARSFLLGSVVWLAVALIGIFLFDGRPYLGAAMSFACLLSFGITQLWYERRIAPALDKNPDSLPLASKPYR